MAEREPTVIEGDFSVIGEQSKPAKAPQPSPFGTAENLAAFLAFVVLIVAVRLAFTALLH